MTPCSSCDLQARGDVGKRKACALIGRALRPAPPPNFRCRSSQIPPGSLECPACLRRLGVQSRCLVEAEAALPAWPLLPGETTAGMGSCPCRDTEGDCALPRDGGASTGEGFRRLGRRGPFSGRRKLVMRLWVAFPLVQTS